MKLKVTCPELTLPAAERRRRARRMAAIVEETLPRSQKARRLVQPGNRNSMQVRRMQGLFARSGWRNRDPAWLRGKRP